MRIARSFGIATCALATIGLFVGYPGDRRQNRASASQSVQAQQPDTRPRAPSLEFGESVPGGLYVGQAASKFIDEYAVRNSKNDPPKCMDGAGGIIGMSVNSQGVLYAISQISHVGRYGYSEFPIYTFGPNCGAKGPTLQESLGFPYGIAIDKKSGRVYVTWYPTSGNGGGVIVYEKGSLYPTYVLSGSVLAGANYGIAVSSAGNVFTGGYLGLVEFIGGRQSGHIVLNPPGLSSIQSLDFDRNDNLIANTGSTIMVYAAPYNAAPILTITAKGVAFDCKVDKPNQYLYCSDYTNGSVDVYAYPSGAYAYSITNGLKQANVVWGIAIAPPSP
jgi:hypothetical protein